MCRWLLTLLIVPLVVGCGASMRPIPDDVEPAPQHLVAAPVMDAGAPDSAHATAATPDSPANDRAACTDGQHRPLRTRRIAPDRWLVTRAVVERVLRNDGARFTPRPGGLVIEDAGTGCVAALGFESGDVLRSVNGQDVDTQSLTSIYQSVLKDGSAVVRFDRRGRSYTVVYEVSNE